MPSFILFLGCGGRASFTVLTVCKNGVRLTFCVSLHEHDKLSEFTRAQ